MKFRRLLRTGKEVKALCLLVLVCLFVCNGCASSSTTTEDIGDDDIARAVWNALQDQHRVAYRKITVKTMDGKVELTGSVPSRFAKMRAGQIAESIRGVDSVENRLSVVSIKYYE